MKEIKQKQEMQVIKEKKERTNAEIEEEENKKNEL